MITVVLVIGIRESANSNNAMVLLKIAIILFFCAVGVTLIKPSNWNDPAMGGFAPNGFAGISAGAAIIFFSYIGFDATSTAAEEAKDPGRDMPFGIIMSLVVCTVLYIVLALVMTGMAPWQKLGTAEPMITALALADGSPRLITLSRLIVSLGAVIAMSSVLLVFQLGQPRIFMSMARDGLLPPFLARVHPRFKTPYIGTIITGLFVATFAAFANIAEVVDLTNIGTLFAFVLVSAGVIVLRRHGPGPGTSIPRALGAGHADHLDRDVPLPDAAASADHLDPVRRVAAAGSGDLLPIRHPAQPAGKGVGGAEGGVGGGRRSGRRRRRGRRGDARRPSSSRAPLGHAEPIAARRGLSEECAGPRSSDSRARSLACARDDGGYPSAAPLRPLLPPRQPNRAHDRFDRRFDRGEAGLLLEPAEHASTERAVGREQPAGDRHANRRLEVHHRQQADGELRQLACRVVGDALRQRVTLGRGPEHVRSECRDLGRRGARGPADQGVEALAPRGPEHALGKRRAGTPAIAARLTAPRAARPIA